MNAQTHGSLIPTALVLVLVGVLMAVGMLVAQDVVGQLGDLFGVLEGG